MVDLRYFGFLLVSPMPLYPKYGLESEVIVHDIHSSTSISSVSIVIFYLLQFYSAWKEERFKSSRVNLDADYTIFRTLNMDLSVCNGQNNEVTEYFFSLLRKIIVQRR